MKKSSLFFFSLLTIIFFYVLLIWVTIWLAGTSHLPFFWWLYGIQGGLALLSIILLDAELLRERYHPQGRDMDTKSVPWLGILFGLQLLIACLDVGRFHISTTVPASLQWVGLGLQLFGWIGMIWAMRENRYFSSAVRIQKDRGQTVISNGPYHWIRHPGYIFGTLIFVSQGLALGSWLAVIPGLFAVGVFIRRTLLEEKMLFQDLSGYPEYAKTVPYRWIPYIW